MTPLRLQVGRVEEYAAANRTPSHSRIPFARVEDGDNGLAPTRAFNHRDLGLVIHLDELHGPDPSARLPRWPAGAMRKWRAPAFVVHPLLADKRADVELLDGEFTDRADRIPVAVDPVRQG